LVLVIMAAGLCSGLLLARVERVRIRHEEHPSDLDEHRDRH
jgi:hypothetical protein